MDHLSLLGDAELSLSVASRFEHFVWATTLFGWVICCPGYCCLKDRNSMGRILYACSLLEHKVSFSGLPPLNLGSVVLRAVLSVPVSCNRGQILSCYRSRIERMHSYLILCGPPVLERQQGCCGPGR